MCCVHALCVRAAWQKSRKPYFHICLLWHRTFPTCLSCLSIWECRPGGARTGAPCICKLVVGLNKYKHRPLHPPPPGTHYHPKHRGARNGVRAQCGRVRRPKPPEGAGSGASATRFANGPATGIQVVSAGLFFSAALCGPGQGQGVDLLICEVLGSASNLATG